MTTTPITLDDRDQRLVRQNLYQWLTGPASLGGRELTATETESLLAHPDRTTTCARDELKHLLTITVYLPGLGTAVAIIHPSVDYRVEAGDPAPEAVRFTWPWHLT